MELFSFLNSWLTGYRHRLLLSEVRGLIFKLSKVNLYRSTKKQDVLTAVVCERSPVCLSGSGYTQQYRSSGRRLPLIISTGSVHGERQEILLLLAACQSCWLTQICDVCVLAFDCYSVVCFTACVFTIQRVCVTGCALCSCACVSVWVLMCHSCSKRSSTEPHCHF